MPSIINHCTGRQTAAAREFNRYATSSNKSNTFSSTGFLVIFNKDIYTEEHLVKLGLNERQIEAALYVKEKGRITNKEYQELVNTTKKTASRDLVNLVEKDVFAQVGTTGKGTYYLLKETKET